MTYSIISSVILPAIAIAISLISVYVSSLHRSVDLAIKYSDLHEKEKANEDICDFDKVLNHQVELAYRFYLWKSFARINEHKRSKFNYASFLVFTFGWLGMGLAGVLGESPEGYEKYYVYLTGAGCMVVASAIIAYSRYQANLYRKFVSMRRNGLYQPTYAAVYEAKDSVLNESVLPIILSFAGSLIAVSLLGTKAASLIWYGTLSIITAVLNIQIIRNGSKKTKEEKLSKAAGR